MGFLDSLITASCVGLSGNANDACQKALQAGAKQSNIEQNVNSEETKIAKDAELRAKYILGNKFNLVGGTLFLANSVANKSLMIALPPTPICKSAKLSVGSDKSTLSLEWKF